MLLFCYIFLVNARVAQLVEHITDTDGVPGSNPGTRTRDYLVMSSGPGHFSMHILYFDFLAYFCNIR